MKRNESVISTATSSNGTTKKLEKKKHGAEGSEMTFSRKTTGHFSTARGEQDLIEESLTATHELILHQRDESQIEQANLWEAEALRKAHDLEHDLLVDQQQKAAMERKERASTKNMHLRMCAALKAHQRTIHQLERAQELAAHARDKQDYLRQTFQKKMVHRSERQVQEQKNLVQSQKRMQRNLIALQKLENMNVDPERLQELVQVQKLGAQHLQELQKKDAEQLREVEALQAKSMGSNFEFELKCAWQEEVLDAAHISAAIHLELSQTQELEMAKEAARNSRNLLKASQLKLLQELQAKQLKAKQTTAAESLIRGQGRKSSSRRKAFELGQEAHMYDVLAATTGSNVTGSHTQSQKASSRGAGIENAGSCASGSVVDAAGDAGNDEQTKKDVVDAQSKDTQDANYSEELKVMDREELEQVVRKNEQAVEDLREQQAADRIRMAQAQKKEKQALKAQWREAALQIKDREEAEFKSLKRQHAQDKEHAVAAQVQERESMLKALRIDTQMEKLRQEDAGNRAKGEFLQYVCHELRNPLTAVFGLCNFMLSDEDELSVDNVELLLSQARVMNCIVDDVLDLNTIQQGKLSFELVPFNLRALFSIICDEMRMFRTATEKHVKIMLNFGDEVPEYVISDPTRLRQVITNFLSNAVKFCQQDGTTKVSVFKSTAAPPAPPGSGEKELPPFYTVEVSDDGIGITAADVPNLFKPFSQLLTSTHREYGGSGLGLSISKGLIESMGGSIGAKPLPKGACFWFTLPFASPTSDQVQVLMQPRRGAIMSDIGSEVGDPRDVDDDV